MICKHECPICGLQYKHLCDSLPKESIGLILVLSNSIEYMPPCDNKDYLTECYSCSLNREIFK